MTKYNKSYNITQYQFYVIFKTYKIDVYIAFIIMFIYTIFQSHGLLFIPRHCIRYIKTS